MPGKSVADLYVDLKRSGKADLKSAQTRALLESIARESHEALLATASRINLKSLVREKTYHAYKTDRAFSRPVNSGLFEPDQKKARRLFAAVGADTLSGLGAADATRAIYTTAMAFAAGNDILKVGDQKTPGTFFELLIGHVFARQFDLNPSTSIKVLNLDMGGELPTDFIFDLGVKKPKFHVPIKLSTRERVIQVWAHQRVLDGIYGVGRFKGLLVALAETKLDRRKLEVTEICLPMQWQVYQMFIAQMTRVYYLDVPTKYAALRETYPRIEVRSVGEYFGEAEALISG